jgi:two-component system, cell cycle sensor histidine kinase and response regulator CckA
MNLSLSSTFPSKDETRPLKILIIEDNPGDARLLEEVLRDAHRDGLFGVFESLCYPRLSEGLDCISNEDIDLIILDLNLPDSTGFSTFESVLEKAPSIPILVLTGNDQDSLGLRTVQAGAQDYLVKGQTEPGRIIRSILYALERQQLLDRLTRNKKEIEASHRRLYAILSASSDGILIVDREKRIQFANPAAGTIFAKSPKELTGTTVHFPVHPGTSEFNLKPDEDELSWMELVVGEIEWDECLAHLVSIRDITTRKAMENRLRHSQKIEALGRLAGGVAHEFNNILAIIGGFNQLVLRSGSLNESRPWLRKIHTAVKRGTELATQLLGFTRQGKYEPEPLCLNEILESTIEMVSPTVKRTVNLSQDLDPNLNTVLADHSQMESVFVNLFINADDSMPDQGSLKISSSNTHLNADDVSRHTWNFPPGDYVVIRVEDSGSGMPPEVQERIFEPFYTTKEQGKGTGLGLATVYGIVKNHEGHIVCDSHPSTGTIFSLYFPITEGKATSLPTYLESEAHSKRDLRGTILIVDDEMDILYLLKEMLRELGYESIWASNGVEAVKAFGEYHLNLKAVLLDLRMPVMPGTETYYKLREISDAVPVIMLSGFHRDKDVDQLLADGASAFVQKPYNLDDIERVLNDALT